MSMSIFKDYKQSQQLLDGTLSSGVNSLMGSGSSQGATTAAATDNATHKHFQCCMLNKNGMQTPYILQLGEGAIKVLSFQNGKEKAALSLELAHGRLLPKQKHESQLQGQQPMDAREESKGEE